MSLVTAVQDAEKAVQCVLSFFANVNTVCNILQKDSPDKRPILHNNSYLDYAAIRDSILSKGVNNVDWLQSAVDRVNVTTFTTAVWLDNVRYDEAISNFFPLLIPKQLHARDDIIDLFLTTVTRWAIAETRWPTGIHTTDDVIKKIKQRIQKELKGKDALLSQRIWSAFKAIFEHLDSTPLWDLQNMVNANRMQERWFKALPMVLEAIDRKDEYNDTLRYDPKQDYHCEALAVGTHAGMKRSHDQEDPVDKRYRREPIVISAISDEEDVESHDEHTRDDSSNEDEYYDALDTWGMENGSNVDNHNMKETPLCNHGLPPPSSYHLRERHDPSSSRIVSIPPLFYGNSARNNNNHHHHLNYQHPSSNDSLQLASINNTQQQDDQANNQSSNTTTAAFETQGSCKKKARRTYRPWTKEEIEALEEGVRLYGRDWARIKEFEIFSNRTRDQLGATARSIAKRRRRKQMPLGSFASLL